MANIVGEWTVWGDDPKAVLEGTEEMCKSYVVDHQNDPSLYVAGPDGSEWEYRNDRWEKC